MRIIPAIDIINGKCVRLEQGKYDQKKNYHEDPIQLARTFEDAGVKYLHLVDLDGAKARKIINHNILKSISRETDLHVDFGGGIQTEEELKKAFENGARQVTLGSMAVNQPEVFMQFLQKYGADKIILGADCKNRKIATHGWMEESEKDVLEFIQHYEDKGTRYTVCTDISKDGMLQGPSFELYKEILNNSNIKLIASGGISSIDDLYKLRDLGCEVAIIGKAIYEGNISLKELTELC
jgi:phosphoribosylformimino-5-aminoimidazole carboxamide ribotide isomerase